MVGALGMRAVVLGLLAGSVLADDPVMQVKPPAEQPRTKVVAGARAVNPTPGATNALLQIESDPYAVPDPRTTVIFSGPAQYDSAGNAIRRVDLRNYLGNDWPTPLRPDLIAVDPRWRYSYNPWEAPWVTEQQLRILREDERDQEARAFNQADMARRNIRLLNYHDQALQQGLDHLRAGEYQKAVLKFTMASKLNEGDPASRIHLAQARLALGHYAEAAAVLRRALQLQPKLIYADLELDSFFPEEGTLKKATQRLGEWMHDATPTAEIEFLYGFFQFQCENLDSAHRAFQRAAVGLRKDNLTHDLLEVTKPASMSAVDR